MIAFLFRVYGVATAIRTLCLLIFLSPSLARAESATVAVAANFATTLERLIHYFEQAGDHDIRIVQGSTGKLYTQIHHGAPFDIFLAADTDRPDRLVADGLAMPENRIPYAIGRLVLWSGTETPSEALLRSGTIRRLAIANPELAPYGAAAKEVLAEYGLTDERAPALVMGENVAQTVAMLATGNVDHGLIPLSMASAFGGEVWTVPDTAHAPVRQDAVLLKRGRDNPAARAFFAFLQSDAARAIITADGYGEATP